MASEVLKAVFPQSFGEFATGLALVSATYALIFALHVVVPGSTVKGYAVDYATRKPLEYRLNGLIVLCAATGGLLNLYPAIFTLIAHNFAGCVQAANVIGLGVSAYFYARGRAARASGQVPGDKRALTVDVAASASKISDRDEADFDAVQPLARFYFGYEWNPRVVGERVDVKMFLYVVGAVQLAINLYAAYYYAIEGAGGASQSTPRAFLCYQIMLSVFLIEYLYFEYVHIYTYDIFCERVGFKLIWGCLCFYPFFYCIGVWSVAEAWRTGARDVSQTQFAVTLALYVVGWVLTRGANLQKYYCKTAPDRTRVFFGAVAQRFVPGSRQRLLCSGFWRLSRHINYLGEIVQALALAVPGFLTTKSFAPFLYPLYYVALLLPRAVEDEKICRRKYGADVWKQYEREVPYRVIPYVF